MADNNPSISIDSIFAALDNELEDMYADGILSADYYNKKNQKRILLWAINAADRHICLNMKISAHIAIYVPADERTIFFQRQKEYVEEWLSAHDDVEDVDALQYAYLIDQYGIRDVISVLSNYAYAYQELPVNDSPDAKEVLVNSLASQTEDKQSYKYATTTGQVKTQFRAGRRFFVEPNSRKMVLSEAFSEARWVKFKAQVAPVDIDITKLSTTEIEHYKILCPYYCRQWLIIRAMIELLSVKAANAAGYFEVEQKARTEAYENVPGTGNVILSGHDLDGNYESSFND